MKKSNIVLLFSSVCILILLTGCGQKTSPTPTPDSSTEPDSPPVSTPAPDGVQDTQTIDSDHGVSLTVNYVYDEASGKILQVNDITIDPATLPQSRKNSANCSLITIESYDAVLNLCFQEEDGDYVSETVYLYSPKATLGVNTVTDTESGISVEVNYLYNAETNEMLQVTGAAVEQDTVPETLKNATCAVAAVEEDYAVLSLTYKNADGTYQAETVYVYTE